MDLDPGTLVAGLVVSTIGFSLFLYGKKQARAPQLVAGLVLMLLPMVGVNAWWQTGLALATVIGLKLTVRAGL